MSLKRILFYGDNYREVLYSYANRAFDCVELKVRSGCVYITYDDEKYSYIHFVLLAQSCDCGIVNIQDFLKGNNKEELLSQGWQGISEDVVGMEYAAFAMEIGSSQYKFLCKDFNLDTLIKKVEESVDWEIFSKLTLRYFYREKL